MSDFFRNPYHFIPTGPGAPPERLPTKDLEAPWAEGSASAHLTHDRYVPGTHSGRIVCKVTVETPLICGNKQVERPHWTKLIQPFTLEGQPAIPGSALRGMISALAEAASHSSLRVLRGDTLSFRRTMMDEQKLSAIGLVLEEQGELRLRPLCLPTLEMAGSSYPVPSEYRPLFRAPAVKVYVGNYPSGPFKDASSNELTNAQLDPSTGTLGPFYGMKLEAMPDSWQNSANPTLPSASWNRYPTKKGHDVPPNTPDPHYLIGRKASDPAIHPWASVSTDSTYTRGIFRALGFWGSRADDRPSPKKHELFIPYTEAMESWPTFPITALALQRFNELADQRSADDSNHPFQPIGTSRGPEANKLRIKAGDVVYFRPELQAGAPVIAEVSFSSIWRGRAETAEGHGADTRAFFAKHSPDLVPLHPDRTDLTLAEQLFGAVSVLDKKQQLLEHPAFSLASRLRISHGILERNPIDGCYINHEELLTPEQKGALRQNGYTDIPLKNLASPKLPSPTLYFRPKNDKEGLVRKKDFSLDHEKPANAVSPLDRLAPMGRKFYLRRKKHDQVRGNEVFVHPERLANPKECKSILRQHQSVHQFIRPGCEFYFHLDYHNLSDLELQLILYALAPSLGFRHQIGHGKPLGLGQIKLDIAGLLEINRYDRYATPALDSARYTTAFISETTDTWPSQLQEGLPAITKDLAHELSTHQSAFRTWAAKKQLTEVLSALELLGTPPSDDVPTHYPQTHEPQPTSSAFEKEHFKWFMDNDRLKDKQAPQFLPSLLGKTSLPTLNRKIIERQPPAGANPAQEQPRPQHRHGAHQSRASVQPSTPLATGLKTMKGQTIEVTVEATEPKLKLFVMHDDKKVATSLSGIGDTKSKFAALQMKPGESFTGIIHDYNPGNLQIRL